MFLNTKEKCSAYLELAHHSLDPHGSRMNVLNQRYEQEIILSLHSSDIIQVFVFEP